MNVQDSVDTMLEPTLALDDSLLTAEEFLPALVELGIEMEKAWQMALPFMLLHCSDDRLALILGKRQQGLLGRFWKWLTE